MPNTSIRWTTRGRPRALRTARRRAHIGAGRAPHASPISLSLRSMAAGRHPEAEQILQEEWGRAPSVAVACLLARLRRRSAGAEGALGLVSQARSRFPGSVRLVVEEARLLESLGRWDAAAQAWARVRARRPSDRRAEAAHLAACIRSLPNDLAISELRSLLRLPRLSGSVPLHRLLARLLEQAGQSAEALAAWRAAGRAAPSDTRLQSELVFALRRCGRRHEAFPGLLALVAAQPRRTPALAALVADARALGRVGPARRLLIELARRDPDLRHLWGWVRRLGTGSATPGRGTEGR